MVTGSTKKRRMQAFTLVELLLYMAVIAVVVGAVSALLFAILESHVKSQTVVEVEQQGAQIMQVVTQQLRNSQSIDTPSPGSSGSTLEIETPGGKIEFEVDNGALVLKEGTGMLAPKYPLNNSRVVISGVNFANFSRTATPGTVRVQFTLTYVNPGGRNAYDYAKVFYATGTLR